MLTPSIIQTALVVLTAFPSASTALTCPPLGAVLPAPQAPAKNNIIKTTVSSLIKEIHSQLDGKVKASAISISAKSIHEGAPFLNYHFTPPALSGIGTSKIDENTIYRVGSISKLMPALMVLLQDGVMNMQDPVTKYIPELAHTKTKSTSDITSVNWEQITVGALASHLAGLAGDSATDLAVFPAGNWANKGLPAIPKNKSPPSCSGYPGTRPCTAEDLIRDMQRRAPIYLPYTTPVYSNMGFAILGLVVESATKKTFNEVVQTQIFNKLGMKSSAFDGLPKTFLEKGFVPLGESTWNLTLGVYESAGGMVSSTTDLLLLGQSILSHTLLTPAKTRQWLQPNSATTATNYLVGSPWEILRSDAATSDGHTVDVYTKTGDLGLYHAVIALIPDYDVVVTVMTGGPEVTIQASRKVLLSSVLTAIIPALETVGREETTKSGVVGRFSDKKTNSTMVLGMDAGPGLVIGSLTVRGFDVLNNYGSYGLSAAYGAVVPSNKGVGRLYPTDRVDGKGGKKTAMEERAWRGIIDAAAKEGAKEEHGEFYEGSKCSWGTSGAAYNFLDLLDFVVVSRGGKDAGVTEIRSAAFDVVLRREY